MSFIEKVLTDILSFDTFVSITKQIAEGIDKPKHYFTMLRMRSVYSRGTTLPNEFIQNIFQTINHTLPKFVFHFLTATTEATDLTLFFVEGIRQMYSISISTIYICTDKFRYFAQIH